MSVLVLVGDLREAGGCGCGNIVGAWVRHAAGPRAHNTTCQIRIRTEFEVYDWEVGEVERHFGLGGVEELRPIIIPYLDRSRERFKVGMYKGVRCESF